MRSALTAFNAASIAGVSSETGASAGGADAAGELPHAEMSAPRVTPMKMCCPIRAIMRVSKS
jgi:hypothetical protein